MRKKLISSILIVIFFFAVLLGIYKTNYNSIIKTYGGEVSESFPEKIPEEAVKTDVYSKVRYLNLRNFACYCNLTRIVIQVGSRN